MSDAPQGPGWWQASDGKWYPPEQAPAASTPPPTPGQVPPGSGMAPPGGSFGAPGAVGKLDLGSALSYGWNKFTQYIGQIIVLVLALVAVNVVFFFIGNATDNLFISLFFSIARWLVSMIISLGLVRVALDVTAGQPVDVANVFKTDKLGPYIVASILYGLATLVGLLFFCIGALIVGFLLWYYPFFILDKNEDAVQSLSSSFNMVKNNIGELLILTIVLIGLMFISCWILAPMAWFSSAYAYRTLNGQPVAP